MRRGEIAFAGGANPSEIVVRRSGKRTLPVTPAKARVQSLPRTRTGRLLERSRASFPAFVGMTNERLILEVAIRSR